MAATHLAPCWRQASRPFPANGGSLQWQDSTVLPPRDATDGYLDRSGRKLDIAFDVDLGELVRGHHVVARDIELGREVEVQRWQNEQDKRFTSGLALEAPESDDGQWYGIGRRTLTESDLEIVGTRLSEPELHYEFVPGLQEMKDDPFYWYWMLAVSDDVGTTYQDSNNGARGPSTGGPATYATRDLGGHVPDSATQLLMRFTPANRWDPPEPWVRDLTIDLRLRAIIKAH